MLNKRLRQRNFAHVLKHVSLFWYQSHIMAEVCPVFNSPQNPSTYFHFLDLGQIISTGRLATILRTVILGWRSRLVDGRMDTWTDSQPDSNINDFVFLLCGAWSLTTNTVNYGWFWNVPKILKSDTLIINELKIYLQKDFQRDFIVLYFGNIIEASFCFADIFIRK